MDKPGRNEPAIAHLAYGLCQMADERKEHCIHCGAEWYSIHYKDGVCHSCQQRCLPGRTELARRDTREIIAITGALVILAVVVLMST